MMRAVAVLAVLASGCWVTHLPKNALGHADPLAPPADVTVERTETPADPGERVVTTYVAGTFDVGFQLERPTEATGVMGAGAAIAFGWYDRATSHERRDHVDLFLARHTTWGVGWRWRGDPDVADSMGHVLHAEWQRRFLLLQAPARVAVGWDVDVTDGAMGPHAEVIFMAGNRLRVSYLAGRGVSIEYGVVLELPSMAWVWSR